MNGSEKDMKMSRKGRKEILFFFSSSLNHVNEMKAERKKRGLVGGQKNKKCLRQQMLNVQPQWHESSSCVFLQRRARTLRDVHTEQH